MVSRGSGACAARGGGGENAAEKSVEVSPPLWQLPDRVGFAEWIQSVFAERYREEEDRKNSGKAGGGKSLLLFARQRFVRDFLQDGSPYPGLILYHAMGVGKSRAAIAAMQALESGHRLFVMLPASSRGNFVEELRKYGAERFARSRRWAPLRPDGTPADVMAAAATGQAGTPTLPPLRWEAVAEEGGLGLPFEQLPERAKADVRARLARLQTQDVRFVHLDGLTPKVLDELCGGENNPFEGAAVVIDEAHNFVSSVVNGGLARHIYARIMDAERRKVILLTGTPFVNNVLEMPYMLNLARGPLRLVRARVRVRPTKATATTSGDDDQRDALERGVRAELEACGFVNRFTLRFPLPDASLLASAAAGGQRRGRRGAGKNAEDEDAITVDVCAEPTPPGFVRVAGRAADDGRKGGGEEAFVAPLLSSSDSSSSSSSPSWSERVRQAVVAALRRSASSSPVAVSGHVERQHFLFPMGEAFLRDYTAVVREKGAAAAPSGDDDPILRQVTLSNREELERRAAGLVSYFAAYDMVAFPERLERAIVRCPMSDYQFDVYKGLREEERRTDRMQRIRAAARARGPPGGAATAGGKINSSYRASSRQACTFVFPPELPRPRKGAIARARSSGEREGEEASSPPSSSQASGGIDDNDEDEGGERQNTINREYDRRLTRATELLMSPPHVDVLRLDGRLREHSPKFHAMLSHFRDVTSSSSVLPPTLVYSQFRKAEGIGLLATCLDANGYARVHVARDAETGEYRLRRTLPPSSRPKKITSYMVYDTSDREASTLLLNAFNSDFEALPPRAREDARALLPSRDEATQRDENLHGGLASLLLVTESGSEAITLKNVREVHVLEPYWNMNRVDQVIGRAVRTNSHARLPPAERRVATFVYTATFTPEQLAQRSATAPDGGQTSDEYVHELAKRKALLIDDMLGVLRRASVDCRMHRRAHRALDARHGCTPRLAGPGVAPDDFTYALPGCPGRTGGSANGATAAPPGKGSGDGQGLRLQAVRVAGRPFYRDPASGRLYDYEALKSRGELVEVPQRQSKK